MSDSETAYGYFQSLTLENVRCFRAPVALDLSDGNGKPARWTVILGDNGTGKSTVLQCLVSMAPKYWTGYNLSYSAEESVAALPLSALRVGDERLAVGATIALAGALDQTPYHAVSVLFGWHASGDHDGDTYTFSRPDRWELAGDEPPPHMYHPAQTLYVAYGAYRRLPRNGALAKEPSGPVESLFDSEARLTNPEDWYLQRDYAASNPRNSDAMRAEAAASRDLVAKALIELLPDVRALEPVTTDARSGTTELHAHTPYGRVRVGDLGLGYQSTMAWVVDLAARMIAAYPDSSTPLAEPAVCLVDEIDLHLHPRWQRTLLGELAKHFPNVQFIVTAHSPLIVQGAPDVNLAVLRRQGDTVTIDNDPIAVRNWRVDQILTSDLFGLEGARDPETDELIAKRDRLLAKSELTVDDEAELARLKRRIGELPQGESREQQEAMELILRAAAELKAGGAPKKKAAGSKGRGR